MNLERGFNQFCEIRMLDTSAFVLDVGSEQSNIVVWFFEGGPDRTQKGLLLRQSNQPVVRAASSTRYKLVAQWGVNGLVRIV